MKLSVNEIRTRRIRERNGTQEVTGPWWALLDTGVREVIYAFDDASEARERLKWYSEAGCVGCKLKRCDTLADVIGWHEPFTGEDEIARRERGQNLADFQRTQGYGA